MKILSGFFWDTQRGDKVDQFGSRGLNEIILLGALPNQKKRRHLIVRNYANKSSPKFLSFHLIWLSMINAHKKSCQSKAVVTKEID